MKYASLFLCACALLAPAARAQNVRPSGSLAETQLVILSNKRGEVRINGIDRGPVEADLPMRLPVQAGEHVVEVFAGEQRFRETISVQRDASQVVQVRFPTFNWREWPEALTNDVGIEFVRIMPGSFVMGSDILGNDEQPAHEVALANPFYIGKTEVTQAQWRAVMSGNPSEFKADNHPVESVSWNEVQTFIDRLNEREGCAGCYRLPTEAEWEYAARAGTNTTYSFGNNTDDLHIYAWYAANSGESSHPVAQKQPNPWGLYDMHGNVWEWVQDEYGPYAGNVKANSRSTGSHRVYRGGSWSSIAMNVQPANRNYEAAAFRSKNTGFRVVRTVP